MEITAEQYKRIQDSLPIQRGNVKLQNLQVLNAILYVASKAANGAVCRLDLATGIASIRA